LDKFMTLQGVYEKWLDTLPPSLRRAPRWTRFGQISDRLMQLDIERKKLSGQLNELETAERVLKGFGRKAVAAGRPNERTPCEHTAGGETQAPSTGSPTGVEPIAERCEPESRASAWRGRQRQRSPQLYHARIRDDGPAGRTTSVWHCKVTAVPADSKTVISAGICHPRADRAARAVGVTG